MENLVIGIVAFTSGWGFMDIMNRYTKIPDWSKFVLLFAFAWAISVVL